jgi:hypothetical protein
MPFKPADFSSVTSSILVCGLQYRASSLRIVVVVVVFSSETSVSLHSITQRRIIEATVFIRKTIF